MLELEKNTKQILPKVAVGVLVIAPDGEVLLLESHKWKGEKSLPAGKLEYGESLEDAAKREVKEETNLILERVEFARFSEGINPKGFFKEDHFINFNFLGFLKNNEDKDLVFLNDEAQRYHWVSLESARKLSLNVFTREIIEWYYQRSAPKEAVGLKKLSIDCLVGRDVDEKYIPQELLIDLTISKNVLDTRNVKLAVDQVEIAKLCKSIALAEHHSFIESLAEKIVDAIFSRFAVKTVEITITKPLGILGCEGTFVTFSKTS